MRNTSLVGEVSRTQIMATLARRGKRPLVPLGDFQRYDFVFEDEEGRFFRVQCKTGRLRNGAVSFYPCSVDSRSQPGRCIRRPYTNEVDYFGVYCPDNDKIYLVPVSEATETQCLLRINPPRNGQKTKIRWARDFEIGQGVPEAIFLPQTAEGSAPE
jgi:hypothetical protein